MRDSYLSIVKPVEEAHKAITLSDLWGEYTDYKSQTLTPTTINKDYKRTGNVIKALPSQSLSDAVIIRDYLLAHKSPNAAQKILVLLFASCDWGIKQKLIHENPFTGMAAEIKVPINDIRKKPLLSLIHLYNKAYRQILFEDRSEVSD